MDRHAHSRRFLLALILAFLLWFSLQYRPGFGVTRAMAFGEAWWEERLSVVDEGAVYVRQDSFGYDGQFYAQIATDPLLTDPALNDAIDVVSYRARRIAMPVFGYMLGFGQPAWILQLFPLINVLAWLGILILLARHLPSRTWEDKARWFAILFAMGCLESVKFSLTDLPAAFLLLLAWDLHSRNHRSGAWAALVTAGLTRETSLLAAVAIPDRMDRQPASRWIRVAFIAAGAALPFLIWTFYLNIRFPTHSGFAANFDAPFIQWIKLVHDVVGGPVSLSWLERDVFGLIGLAGLVTQIVWLIRHPLPHNPLWRTAIAFAILLPVLGAAVWHGYWAVMRTALPLTIAFNLLYQPKGRFWPVFLLANASILHGLLRV